MSVEASLCQARSSRKESAADAAWLTDQLLLVVAASSFVLEETSTLICSKFSTSRLTLNGKSSLQVLIVRFADAVEDDHLHALGIQVSEDLARLLRIHLASLPECDREDVIVFVAKLMDEPVNQPQRLARNLQQIREALRSRHPSLEDPTAVRGICCEGIVSTGDGCFGVWGWAFDRQSPVARLCVVSPEGARVELIGDVVWHTHSQADALRTRTDRASRSGFFCRFTAPSLSHDGWLIEMHNVEGEALESRAPSLLIEPQTLIQAVLERLTYERCGQSELLTNHVHPLLSRVQKRLAKGARAQEVRDFGNPSRKAAVSIVVPVFEQPDLMEQQLAAFSTDGEIASLAEIIYVLDSPWMAEEFVERGRRWFDLYGLPFRLITLEQRAGFAAACGVGIRAAEGRLLFLMHSDVLSSKPGWLGEMRHFYEQTPSVGAVGARLLYSDNSLQHAGLIPVRRSDAWHVRRPLKGLNARLCNEDTPRPAAAISAACLMIDRQLFQEVGSFCGEYPSGDYEDVDLCMRLSQAGRTNWYLPQVTLYHLEGQSRSRLLSDAAERYNSWLFTSRWGAALDAAERLSAVELKGAT